MSGKNVRSSAFCDSSPNFQDKIDKEHIFMQVLHMLLYKEFHAITICFHMFSRLR